MFTFLHRFFKKINYSRILPVFLCPVLLLCTSISGYAVDFFYNQESFGSPIIIYVDGSSVGDYVNVNSTYNVYHFSNSAKNITSNVHFIFKSSWDLQFDFENFDYYIYSVVDGDNYTGFMPDSVDISDFDSSGTRIYTPLLNPMFTEYNGRFEGDNMYGFSVLAQIPSNYYRPISSIRFNGSGSLSKNIDLTLFCIQVTKAADTAALNGIIAAINNQTDYIVNGDDSTGGIVSQFQSNLNEFNSVINQFDDIENGFISDFTSSNDEIKSTLSDYQFTGNLLTCANWVTDRYMDFFDNSGDFKQYFIYPLIMGIALFFIGRGQVILGQAYRKPYESTTVTSSDSSGYSRNKDGSWSPTGYKGSTTTTTYRSGGKLRK